MPTQKRSTTRRKPKAVTLTVTPQKVYLILALLTAFWLGMVFERNQFAPHHPQKVSHEAR